jgi:hypothetical protein
MNRTSFLVIIFLYRNNYIIFIKIFLIDVKKKFKFRLYKEYMNKMDLFQRINEVMNVLF